MQEALAQAEEQALAVVARDAQLPHQLLLGGGEAGRRQSPLAQQGQLPTRQAQRLVELLRVGTEIDRRHARVGIRGDVRLDRIDQPLALAQGDVEAAVHAGPAQQVVEQEQGDTPVVVQAVGPAAQQDVRLVRLLRHPLADGGHGRRGDPFARRHRPVRGAQPFHRHPADPPEIGPPHREEQHIGGHVIAVHEAAARGGVEGQERPLVAQDRVAQRVPLEKQVLKLVEDQLRGAVLIRVDLVEDHLHLLLDLAGRETGVERQVGHQLERPPEMLLHEDRVDEGLLLRRIGVQLAADVLHAVQDVPRAPLVRPLEKHMLHEMGQPHLVGALVAGAGVHREAAIGHRRVDRQVHQPQAVRQRI